MLEDKQVAAVVVAAGRSSRMGFDKLLYPIDGVEVLRHTVGKMDAQPEIDTIVVVAGQNRNKVRALFAAHPPQKPLVIVEGGATRADSVAAGVAACPGVDIIAIHDGARPFVTAEVISETLAAAVRCGAAAPAVAMRDTIKRANDGMVTKTIAREGLVAVQTPQAFNRQSFLRALASIPQEEYPKLTDDCMVMELAGCPVCLVEGDEANRKITTPEDLRALQQQSPGIMFRMGHGYDVHRFAEGRRLVLGGVEIPYDKGLLGHSDADVLLHAVADALLGALALGDIGRHFPPGDAAYKDIDSQELLAKAAALVRREGYSVQNVDATVLCQAPKLGGYAPQMRSNIARTLGIEVGQVSVKATTEEGLGFTGRQEGMAAHCVVLMGK